MWNPFGIVACDAQGFDGQGAWIWQGLSGFNPSTGFGPHACLWCPKNSFLGLGNSLMLVVSILESQPVDCVYGVVKGFW